MASDSFESEKQLAAFGNASQALPPKTEKFPADVDATLLDAAPAPTWQWDAESRCYVIWSLDEDCWVYETGIRLHRNGYPIPPSNEPRFTGSTSADKLQHTAPESPPHMSYTADGIFGQLGGLNIHDTRSDEAQQLVQSPYTQTQSSYAAQPGFTLAASTTAATESEAPTGDAVARRRTLRGGTPGTHELLNPEFVLQAQPEKFFLPGRIFKVYWPEPSGQPRGNGLTTVTGGEIGVVQGAFGETFHAKIRWFLVVRRLSPGFSSCLMIQTYAGRGVSRAKMPKCQHSIIHTSRDPPKPLPREAPDVKKGEAPMLSPIRVRPRKKTDKLDMMARLNYAKIFTVEHNVKVYNFGVVHEGYLDLLNHQFNTVWGLPVPTAHATNTDEEDDEDDDDDDDDEDDDNQAGQAYIQIREPEPRQRRERSSKGKRPSQPGGKEGKKKKGAYFGFGSSKES